MSTTSAARPSSARTWLPLLAWSQAALGSATAVTLLTSPTPGVVVGLVVALLGLVVNALHRASRTMDRIFEEELDR
ncbi:hypothetical protein [Saccharothrix syringae]|uniref:Uncharacterized protein n=1 Tax=Saccharothrix syringae TaxID=103733 RepID=A0A5Q0GS04_SACSY|nr:hypothetical protein [Saccharothrix syringae]QFZ16274.1 hypothetical protein EKG83_01290 [Saccharothrix syringae]